MLRNLERVCASIEQCACCLGVVIMKRLKPCCISARHLGRVFDFNRMEAVWTVNHKIAYVRRFFHRQWKIGVGFYDIDGGS